LGQSSSIKVPDIFYNLHQATEKYLKFTKFVEPKQKFTKLNENLINIIYKVN